MKPDQFEAKVREGEAYADLRVPADQWIVVRVDGRSFSRVVSDEAKPFDPVVHAVMVDVARDLVREWNAPYGCTHSDEASVLLPYDVADSFLFGHRVEKLVSVSAGLASSTWAGHWTLEGPFAQGGHFDARLWVGTWPEDVIDYFRWRLADAERHAVQGTLYWHRRRQGVSPRAVARGLRDLSTAELRAQLAAEGTTFDALPVEQCRGTALFWENYEKEGQDPRTGQMVRAQRRRIGVAPVPPAAGYAAYLQAVGAFGDRAIVEEASFHT